MTVLIGRYTPLYRRPSRLLNAMLAKDERTQLSLDTTFTHLRKKLRNFNGVKGVSPPATFKGELRPYQKEGLGWLHYLDDFGFGGCLADYDRTTKFEHYKKISTFVEYILVAQDKPFIESFVKQTDQRWLHRSFAGTESDLQIASLALMLEMRKIYRRVTFSEQVKSLRVIEEQQPPQRS